MQLSVEGTSVRVAVDPDDTQVGLGQARAAGTVSNRSSSDGSGRVMIDGTQEGGRKRGGRCSGQTPTTGLGGRRGGHRKMRTPRTAAATLLSPTDQAGPDPDPPLERRGR